MTQLRRRAVLVLAAVAPARAALARDPTAPPPSGFRGLNWGARLPSKLRLVGKVTKEGLGTYTPTTPSPPWEGIPIREEALMFEHGKFYGASLFFDGDTLFNQAKTLLTKQYGPPTFKNEAKLLYKWAWAQPRVSISLHLSRGTSTLTIAMQ